MKKIVLFTLLCSLCYGCTTEEEILPAETTASQEYAIVSLSMGGEIISEDQPLPTRAETSSRDLYGVQVLRGGYYYAYGLFDNTDSIRVALLKGNTYKFVCTLVKNGKDLLKHSANGVYCSQPFGVYNLTNDSDPDYYYYRSSPSYPYRPYVPICRNQFVYDTTTVSNTIYHFNNLGLGKAILTNGATVQYPQMDRYYGELDYTPTIANDRIALPMKRTAFGIKCKVGDIPDGTVAVTCSNSTGTFYSASVGANSEDAGTFITFYNVQGVWQYPGDYTEDVTVGVKWIRGIGATENLGTKDVPVKRNAMNVIRINLDSSDGDASFGITPEDTPMGEEGVEVPLK
jgi:hypothetical protein